MKSWAANHPKANLMARKRSAILDAARELFLRQGFGGTSMEAIAAAAGVSIMTLYRHAESKEDLFAAVISGACDPSDEGERAEMAALMQQPLEQILTAIGAMFLRQLASAETASLLRAVMAESSRFPELAQTAYRGLVGHVEDIVAGLLAQREEAQALGEEMRRELSVAFVDRLFGADVLRILLGIGPVSPRQHHERAARSAVETLAALSSGRD